MELLRTEGGAVRRWFRSAFTRESILGSLTTLAWVVPLTVLIWIYAEREQLFTDTSVPIPIEVNSGDPNRVVTIIRPAEKMVMADLQGPRSRVELVKSSLSGGDHPTPLTIGVDGNLTPGQPHDIQTKSVLESTGLFEHNGVVVTNCQPPILTVFVDVFEEVELPVLPPPSITNLVGTPTFQPAKVKLRAPSKVIDRVRSSGPMVAYADVANLDELRTPGVHEVPAAHVFIPGLDAVENVSLTPTTVKATLEVRQSDVPYTIPAVAIYTFGPSFLMKQYRVDCPESITNVKVIGPANMIEMIKNQTAVPKAALEIGIDDRPIGNGAKSGSKALRYYDLPDGVRMAPDDAQRMVDYKLEQRTTEQ